MQELEDLFVDMITEKKSDIVKVLKDSFLKEIVCLCYEVLVQSAMENDEIDAKELYEKVLEIMEKNGS